MKLKFIIAVLLIVCGAFTVNANAAKHERTAAKAEVTAPVNINSADTKALMTLKGVGEKKAAAIIAYREQNGAFKSVDDLAKVKGFGAKRVATLLKNNPNRIVLN